MGLEVGGCLRTVVRGGGKNLLTLLGYIPGIVHAVWNIAKR
ncbi:MAG: YqaE/Pmp3 family membrane protein [Desulfurivibrionaceae bacterium]